MYSMTPKVFGELVEVVLLTGFRDTVQEIQRNKSIVIPGSDEIKRIEQHENFLWTLVRERKIMKAEMATHKNWQREIDEYREVARLYAELDWIVLYHANLVVHDFWSQSESDSWKTLEQKKKEWKGNLDRLLNEYPRSGLLLRLQSSYENLSGKK